MNLNPEQLKAVKHFKGPLLIIAGAGTGKTRVITSRISYLIKEQGVDTENILALTYTRKAAEEMRERVENEIGQSGTGLWVGTIHSFCSEILRKNSFLAGLNPFFSLADETDQLLLIMDNLDLLDFKYVEVKAPTVELISSMLNVINRAKSENISFEEYCNFVLKKLGDDKKATDLIVHRDIVNLYQVYQELLKNYNLLDYGDLINQSIELVTKNSVLLQQLQDQYRFILVDEFQDTDLAQIRLIYLLTGQSGNLCVVGDDDQSIYRFRGASAKNLYDFEEKYPETEKIYLEHNYRSYQQILDAAHSIIEKNRFRLEKKLVSISGLDKENSVYWFEADTGNDEGEFIVRKIRELFQENDCSYSDFAILVRAKNHAEYIIKALSKNQIPFNSYSSNDFFLKTEIKDIVAWCNFLGNQLDNSSLSRLLSSDFVNISHYDLSILRQKAAEFHNRSLFLALKDERILKLLSRTGQKKIQFFLNYTTHLLKTEKEKGIRCVFEEIVFQRDWLKGLVDLSESRNNERFKNIGTFSALIDEFYEKYPRHDIADFLRYLELQTFTGRELNQEIKNNEDAVSVMTIHKAKGLEFKYVFLGAMTSQRMPLTFRRNKLEIPDELVLMKEEIPILDPKELHNAEERRLFYVAMTRAKEKLFLSFARHYSQAARANKISPFISEIIKAGKVNEIFLPENKNFPEKVFYSAPEMLEDKYFYLENIISQYQDSHSQDINEWLKKYFQLEAKNLQTFIIQMLDCPGEDISKLQERVQDDIYDLFKDKLVEMEKSHSVEELAGLSNKKNNWNSEQLVFSASSLSVYEDCPLRFKYIFINQLPEKTNFSMSFGTVIHHILEVFHESFSKEEASEEEMMSLLKMNWQEIKYSDILLENRYFDQAQVALEKYIKDFQNSQANPVKCEKDFMFEINGHKIKGRIDRIDRIGGHFELIDYKTGKIKKPNEVRKELQLPIYYLGAKEALGVEASRVSNYFIIYGEKVSINVDEYDLDKVKQRIVDIINQIQSENFEPVEHYIRCRDCSFKIICPAKEKDY